jgi:altronate hydrolase
MKKAILYIHPHDNVAVAIMPLMQATEATIADTAIVITQDISAGHKLAVRNIRAQEKIFKYGHCIGHVTQDIAAGEWVHTHNLHTDLAEVLEYKYAPVSEVRLAQESFRNSQNTPAQVGLRPLVFQGYRRANGKVGTRNEIWILNTVGCVNISAERIAKICREKFAEANIDGVFSFSHPYGCSQLGDDLRNTQKVLAGLLRHPNAGGVLVLGLGCENNQMEQLLKVAGEVDRSRLRFFNSQDVQDEIESGVAAIGELVERMKDDARHECPLSDLVLGMKCGGSDGFSGITANPLVGRVADMVTNNGGTVLLTEVPEMFGAEQQLMNRAIDEKVFHRIIAMINDFKNYFIRHQQPIYENPSPGNMAGGITTLEEKSLGAIQKGGSAIVSQVLDYGEPAQRGGLALLQAPGNDGVSSTAEVASGATMILFTTGRGTPLGLPVPTIKISSNSAIAQKKPQWIDFNAGALLDGAETLDSLAPQLLDLIIKVASGETKAKNEIHGYKEIAIWKEGVTL